MKGQIFVVLAAFFAASCAVFVPPRPGHKKLVDSIECTWGPSYWCQNLTAASDCHAVQHCIQTVWIHQKLPPDNSDVCQVCLEMVKEARDQLESNETQELIKEVFEGSCALLHFKPIVEECDKIADNYIPDLIDTLASQMNPQIVCSVAGLCNNEKYLKMLSQEQPKSKGVGRCEGCHTVIDILEDKFKKMTRDDVLQQFLQICREMGSLSDGCSNIMITYFTQIYNHLKENLRSEEVCLMAGECSDMFHTHAKVEITPISHIGYIPVDGQNDDLPCELCEQLVHHLRDLLVANTTEDEFKLVLEGLCKQTNSFKAECLSLVDQYYAVVYDFLTSHLDSNVICTIVGICPRNGTSEEALVMPLLPVKTATLEITPAPKNPIIINMAKDKAAVKVLTTPEQAQLPIDRLTPPHTQMYNSETCVFCEYFLHYLQQVITNPQSEDEIKEIIEKACNKLPSSINATCVGFVEMYEPALVAILSQEIDPSQVCPLIRACPSSEVKDVEVFMQQGSDEKCPLCLFAVQKLEEMVKDKRTEANIRNALDNLCKHLPKDLAAECDDFVEAYTNELVEMLVADLNPQEVCVYLKLCSDTAPPKPTLVAGDINTNLIADNTINGKDTSEAITDNGACVLCEFIMKQIQSELKDNQTEENIIKTVHNICNVMPKTISQECNSFVNEYADTVIQLLIQVVEPSEICKMIHLCDGQVQEVKVEIFECAVCEALVYAMEKVLANPKVDHDVDHVLKKACRALPKASRNKCTQIIDKYGKTIYNLVIHLADKGVICKEVNLCGAEPARPARQVGANRCTWGPSYWCDSEDKARECNALDHCRARVWKAQTKQKRELLVGANKCTWGPDHWCASDENAKKCGTGAVQHCQQVVWKADKAPQQ